MEPNQRFINTFFNIKQIFYDNAWVKFSSLTLKLKKLSNYKNIIFYNVKFIAILQTFNVFTALSKIRKYLMGEIHKYFRILYDYKLQKNT